MAFFAVGFAAQLVDGALGMAYGGLTNTALLAIGLPPAHASALVHTAEIFTTSASAASHIYHRNVDWRMVARLGGTGVFGAILGAWVLSNVEVTAARRFVYAYLLIMGFHILWRSMLKIYGFVEGELSAVAAAAPAQRSNPHRLIYLFRTCHSPTLGSAAVAGIKKSVMMFGCC